MENLNQNIENHYLKEELVNVLGHLKSGELELKSGVYKK